MGAIISKIKSTKGKNLKVCSEYGKLKDDCAVSVSEDNKSKDNSKEINDIPVPKTDINGADCINHRDESTLQMSPISVSEDNKFKGNGKEINDISVPKTDTNGADCIDHRDDSTIQMSHISVSEDNKSKNNKTEINGIPVPKTVINGAECINHRDTGTAQMSPILTKPTDDADTWSTSTLSSSNTCMFLENTLLKRADAENPFHMLADGDNRVVRPVNPCIATEQVGQELEKSGIINYQHCDTIGIDGRTLNRVFKRPLPPRLAHLPVEPTLPQKVKDKEEHEFAISKSKSVIGRYLSKQASSEKSLKPLERTLMQIDTDLM